MRSFYKYLIYHSVCPEYRADIDCALKLCDTAEAELSQVYNAGCVLPGAFNTAASTILGGSKAGIYAGDMDWAIKAKEAGVYLTEVGVMNEEARITFRTAVAILGTDDQQALLDTCAVKVTKDEHLNLEVVAINLSDQLTRDMYTRQKEFTGSKLHLEPLGTIICRSIHVDDFDQYDLPKDRYPTGCLPKTEDGKQYEFWVEDVSLGECFVGMKLDARILTLDGGITILDDVREIMCSFYKWLPNELWMSRHPKKVVIRDRSVDEEEEVKEGDDGGDNGEDGGEEFADDESMYGG